MQVTLASVTEDAPWAEPRTTVRVRNYDVSPYRSTLLPSSQQAPPTAACACHSPVSPQEYARSGHAHRAAPDKLIQRGVGSEKTNPLISR